MAWPPSTHSSTAILPSFRAFWISSHVVAMARSSAWSRTCSSTALEQLECAPRRRGPRNLDRHPQREKNCADASLSQPWNIDAPFGVSAAQIKPIEQKSLRGIGVGVENDA